MIRSRFSRAVALVVAAVAVGAIPATAHAITLTEYPVGNQGPGQPNYHHPGSIADGPDGRLWFTDNGCGGYPGICQIGAIATNGTVTEYGAAQLGSTMYLMRLLPGPTATFGSPRTRAGTSVA
jgi:hypothetical protein